MEMKWLRLEPSTRAFMPRISLQLISPDGLMTISILRQSWVGRLRQGENFPSQQVFDLGMLLELILRGDAILLSWHKPPQTSGPERPSNGQSSTIQGPSTP